MIKNEPYYLDRLANAETLSEAVEVAQTLERLGTNEAYPPILELLTRLAANKVPRHPKVDPLPRLSGYGPNEFPSPPPGWEDA
jgi:hypothetical protein